MKSKLALLLALMLLVSVFFGCQATQQPDPTQAGNQPSTGDNTQTPTPDSSNAGDNTDRVAKDTITIVTESEPETLDPASANTDAIALTLGMIGDHLFDLQADGSITLGGICESYEQIDDVTVKFVLKEGVKFSDGTDLTSEDILWELSRLKEAPRSASNFAFVNAEESEIVDDRTIIVKFNQAWAPYQNTLSTGRGTIVSKETFVPGQTTDFSPVLSKIKEKNPDLLYVNASYSDCAQILMQAKALNINCQYVCPGMALTEEFLDVVGTSIDGTLVLSSVPAFLPSVLETAKLDASMQAFVDSYTAEYNEIPDGFAASAFDAVNIVLDACAKVGTDTPALRGEIAQLRDFPGVSGYDMHFNENKEMVKGIYMFQIENGQFVVAE